ncbi:MAG: hypothetical protein IJF69_03065 [Clostridia bacterium]|nr:hypothetical protein [Clostridia bacterium]
MPDFKTYYDNFALDNPTVSITVIMWAICIGLAVGSVFFTFTKHAAASIIKKLARGEYNTKEKTASLKELGLKPTLLLKKALRDGQPLAKYVIIENPDECRIERKNKFFNGIYKHFRKEDLPASYDLKNARFYLPEEVKHTAEIRYESKGSPLISSVICCVLFLLVAVGLSLCMPKLLELVDKMITAYKNL